MSKLWLSTNIQCSQRGFTLVASADHQILLGLGGDDRLLSAFNDTTLDGGAGDDELTATAEAATAFRAEAINTLDGGAGNDILTATATATAAAPEPGVWLTGKAINTLHGGAGNDILTATATAAAPKPGDFIATNTLDGGQATTSSLRRLLRGSRPGYTVKLQTCSMAVRATTSSLRRLQPDQVWGTGLTPATR